MLELKQTFARFYTIFKRVRRFYDFIVANHIKMTHFALILRIFVNPKGVKLRVELKMILINQLPTKIGCSIDL